MKLINLSAIAFFMTGLSVVAEIKVPAFFSDGMVLQQETGAKVWGFGDRGDKINVEFAGQKLSLIHI